MKNDRNAVTSVNDDVELDEDSLGEVAGGMLNKVTLECKPRKYTTSKNERNTPERLELNKYCPFLKKHTAHKETK